MRVAIGCDHSGVEFKEKIKAYLVASFKATITDVGTHTNDSVDYPDYGKKVGELVSSGAVDTGIVICGTGIGISIAANKISGVRAALCHNVYTAMMARQHNDANVLALGARTTAIETAYAIVNTFFSTPFEGGRHQARVEKLSAMTEFNK